MSPGVARSPDSPVLVLEQFGSLGAAGQGWCLSEHWGGGKSSILLRLPPNCHRVPSWALPGPPGPGLADPQGFWLPWQFSALFPTPPVFEES